MTIKAPPPRGEGLSRPAAPTGTLIHCRHAAYALCIIKAAALQIDQAVDVREEGGRIVIEPVHDQAYDLDDLLAAMTPDTFHEDTDFGEPVGKEIW